jgi:hypothetical protein
LEVFIHARGLGTGASERDWTNALVKARSSF